MAPSRQAPRDAASEEPRWRGVSPTTIIASHRFQIFPPLKATAFYRFLGHARNCGTSSLQLSPERKPACQTLSEVAPLLIGKRKRHESLRHRWMCRPISKKPLTTPFKNGIKRCRIRRVPCSIPPSNTANDVSTAIVQYRLRYPWCSPRCFCPPTVPDRCSRAQRDWQASPMRHLRRRWSAVGDTGPRGSDFRLTPISRQTSQDRCQACSCAGRRRARTILIPFHAFSAKFSELAIDRHSFVIAVGGGAVLDASDMPQAIFHRGVRHIRFPTTVLAQNDSGVGVKKRRHQFPWPEEFGLVPSLPPWAIINDSIFIDHSAGREKRAGMAEAVKVALIRNGDFFRWIERNTSCAPAHFSPAASRPPDQGCAELHMRQIGSAATHSRPDRRARWISVTLVCHKLEHLTRQRVNHGER